MFTWGIWGIFHWKLIFRDFQSNLFLVLIVCFFFRLEDYLRWSVEMIFL